MDTLNPRGYFKPIMRMLNDNRGFLRINRDPDPAGNPPAGAPPAGDPPAGTPPAGSPPAGTPPAAKQWYDSLTDPDIKNNPIVTKYKTVDDLVKGHLNLQQLMGHEKVPIPKDENDIEAIKLFDKVRGVPESIEGYELDNPEPLPGMDKMVFGTDEFKAMAHKHRLTPEQAKGIQGDYVAMLKAIHEQMNKDYTEAVTNSKNQLQKDWGMAYDSNVRLAQAVMNKFTASKEEFDALNAKLGTDPVALRFLAKLGGQFKEGSLGDFNAPSSFTKTPTEAKAEYDKIMNDPNDIYWAGVRNNQIVQESVRKERITYVESLLQMSMAGNAK